MNKGKILLYAICQLMSGLITAAFAWVMMQVTDSLIAMKHDDFYKYLILAIAGLFLQLWFSYCSTILVNSLVNQKMSQIRLALFKGMLFNSTREIDEEYKNHNISLFTKELELYENSYVRVLFNLSGSVIALCFSGAMIFMINPILFVTAISMLILILLIPMLFSIKLQEMNLKFVESNEALLKQLREVLEGYEVIKSYMLEHKLFERASDRVEGWRCNKNRFEKKLGITNSVTAGLGMCIIVGCFFVGGQLILQNAITVGGLLALIQLVTNMITPLTQVLYGINSINSTKQIRVNIEACSLQPFEDVDSAGSTAIFENLDLKDVLVENLGFGYEGAEMNILEDVNVRLKSGESYAIVGENGCGKSTFGKLLAGVYEPASGTISYRFKQQLPQAADLRNQITYVSQDSFLFDDTPMENCSLLSTVPWDNMLAGKMECFDVLNRRDTPEKLSGGEKQKLCFLRAVNRGGVILICDEGDSAMDIHSKQLFYDLMAELDDRIRVCITHNVDESLIAFDHILFFKNGKIEEEGTFLELYNNKGAFFEFFNSKSG